MENYHGSFDSDTIILSLKTAFDQTVNPASSIQRIRGALTRLPTDPFYIVHDRGHINFYYRSDSGVAYLRKSSDQIYQLARRRYLDVLFQLLQGLPFRFQNPEKWNRLFNRLEELIRDLEGGNLDLPRIILSPKQYAWFAGAYRQKKPPSNIDRKILTLNNGKHVQSKSEQSIGNALLDLAVPFHYEDALRINVQPLVEALCADLSARNQSAGNLFYYKSRSCWWNVPKELQYMNAPGSLWHTYDYRSGCILIHPDFTIMLADGSLLYWEHEGLLEQPVYRINSAERVAVMRFAGKIPNVNIIETTERESTSLPTLEQIIRAQILPRLWF